MALKRRKTRPKLETLPWYIEDIPVVVEAECRRQPGGLVSTVNGLRRSGCDPQQGVGFSLCHCPQFGSGAHPTDKSVLSSVPRIKLAEA